jgi:hypothetical protein
MLISFSAFIPTPHSSRDLPPLGDDEELWEVFLKLVLKHGAKLTEILADTLNTSLLFVSSSLFTFYQYSDNEYKNNLFQAALFSAVNVGILALSLPTLTQDTVRGGGQFLMPS